MSIRGGANPSEQGFTMVEILIAVGIIATLAGIGLPMISSWIGNRQVSALSDSISNGLRAAQIEAIKSNSVVEFVLTTTDVNTSGLLPNALTLTAGGTAQSSPVVNWAVRQAGSTAAAGLLFKRSAGEGWKNARTAGPAGIGFSPLGRLQYTLDASGTQTAISGNSVFQVLNPSLSASVARRVCVYATPGGAVKTCDPTMASGDPRSCYPQLSTTECP